MGCQIALRQMRPLKLSVAFVFLIHCLSGLQASAQNRILGSDEIRCVDHGTCPLPTPSPSTTGQTQEENRDRYRGVRYFDFVPPYVSVQSVLQSDPNRFGCDSNQLTLLRDFTSLLICNRPLVEQRWAQYIAVGKVLATPEEVLAVFTDFNLQGEYNPGTTISRVTSTAGFPERDSILGTPGLNATPLDAGVPGGSQTETRVQVCSGFSAEVGYQLNLFSILGIDNRPGDPWWRVFSPSYSVVYQLFEGPSGSNSYQLEWNLGGNRRNFIGYFRGTLRVEPRIGNPRESIVYISNSIQPGTLGAFAPNSFNRFVPSTIQNLVSNLINRVHQLKNVQQRISSEGAYVDGGVPAVPSASSATIQTELDLFRRRLMACGPLPHYTW